MMIRGLKKWLMERIKAGEDAAVVVVVKATMAHGRWELQPVAGALCGGRPPLGPPYSLVLVHQWRGLSPLALPRGRQICENVWGSKIGFAYIVLDTLSWL
jgi:hypothetical protein